jgi:hypothetical protein
MSQGIKILQQQRIHLRDAIVRIREEGEPIFGTVGGNNPDNQARIIVQRLLNETNVTQSQFAALIGSHTPNFNQWLNHPGARFIEGLRVIRFLNQLLYEIADELLAVELQKENDRDEGDNGGGSATAAIVGEEVTTASANKKKLDELTTSMSSLSAKDKKASVLIANPTGAEPK